MTADTNVVAQELARWLRTKPGVSDMQAPVISPKQRKSRLPLPLPPFLAGERQPTFVLRFTYKGQQRAFHYFIEQEDDLQTMLSNLRVHTNGELMVRVPSEYGQLMPNEIYYANRSASGTGMGDPARSPGSRP